MKKRHYIALAIVLAGVAACAWIILHPRQLPVEECGDVFRRYKDVEGVAASFIKGFPVNDTLRLDVTTLQARDSAGWERLLEDFHIRRSSELPEIVQRWLNEGKDMVGVHLAPKSDPTLPTDTTNALNNNVVAVSRLYHTISIFYTETESEQKAVSNNNHEKSFF